MVYNVKKPYSEHTLGPLRVTLRVFYDDPSLRPRPVHGIIMTLVGNFSESGEWPSSTLENPWHWECRKTTKVKSRNFSLLTGMETTISDVTLCPHKTTQVQSSSRGDVKDVMLSPGPELSISWTEQTPLRSGVPAIYRSKT